MNVATVYENWEWETLLKDRVVVAQSPINDRLAKRAIYAFETFIERYSTSLDFSDRFTYLLNQWSADAAMRDKFACFYTPYFRNSEPKRGYDDKIVWQFHASYIDRLLDRQLIGPADAKCLRTILRKGAQHLRPFVERMAGEEPDLRAQLLPPGELPIVIRLMRYRPDFLAGTNPHIDKTALSGIIWTSDNRNSQKLIFAHDNADRLSQFEAPQVGENIGRPSCVFFGAAISDFREQSRIRGAVHAVLPVQGDGYRYSIACFWLLSGHPMKNFVTARHFIDDIGILRDYAR